MFQEFLATRLCQASKLPLATNVDVKDVCAKLNSAAASVLCTLSVAFTAFMVQGSMKMFLS